MTDIALETESAPAVLPQDQIRAALVAAWGDLPSVSKDRFNDITKSNYATLDSVIETIKPTLKENGLMPTQRIETCSDHVAVYTTLIHKSGQVMDFPPVKMPVVGKRLKGGGGEYSDSLGPQEFGSAITYARRYSLLAALGISTGDDDDGNATRQANQHRSAHDQAKGQWSKGGSTLKNQVKAPERINEAFGEDRAIKMLGFATGKGVTEEQVRAEVARLTDKNQSEQDISEWPYALAGKITEFIKKNAKTLAETKES